MQHYLILISVLSLFLVLLFIYVYQQIHKLYRIKEELSRTNGRLMQLNDELQRKTQQLTDSNIIKEQYIARFFDLCSMYIDQDRGLPEIAEQTGAEPADRRVIQTAEIHVDDGERTG